MRISLVTVLFVLMGALQLESQVPTPVAATPAFYTVSYVEVMPAPASRGTALQAFGTYRVESRSQDGYMDFQFFEQPSRRGHFVIIEAWRNAQAFDARDTGVHKRLLEALDPIRLSDYDQRPYKPLTVSPATLPSAQIFVITHVDVSPAGSTAAILTRVAQASRAEAGNARFDALQHNVRANHFTVIEGWQSQQALDEHRAASQTRQYRNELGPALGSPLDERIYVAVDPAAPRR
jgi:quinol monooxygenase YgiN